MFAYRSFMTPSCDTCGTLVLVQYVSTDLPILTIILYIDLYFLSSNLPIRLSSYLPIRTYQSTHTFMSIILYIYLSINIILHQSVYHLTYPFMSINLYIHSCLSSYTSIYQSTYILHHTSYYTSIYQHLSYIILYIY